MDKTVCLISWQTFLKYSNDAIKLRLAAFQIVENNKKTKNYGPLAITIFAYLHPIFFR